MCVRERVEQVVWNPDLTNPQCAFFFILFPTCTSSPQSEPPSSFGTFPFNHVPMHFLLFRHESVGLPVASFFFFKFFCFYSVCVWGDLDEVGITNVCLHSTSIGAYLILIRIWFSCTFRRGLSMSDSIFVSKYAAMTHMWNTVCHLTAKKNNK